MASPPEYLIDTNVLLRLSRYSDPLQPAIESALSVLDGRGAKLYYSLQNIAEFWNIATRPAERNGYGLSIAKTNTRIEYIERTMTLLPDTAAVYAAWRRLVSAHNVRGIQVHDVRLAAIMEAHRVTNILTLNQPDFVRYSEVRVVHPSEIQL